MTYVDGRLSRGEGLLSSRTRPARIDLRGVSGPSPGKVVRQARSFAWQVVGRRVAGATGPGSDSDRVLLGAGGVLRDGSAARRPDRRRRRVGLRGGPPARPAGH